MNGFQKATQQQTKNHNSHLVLKAIYDQGKISRADLARLPIQSSGGQEALLLVYELIDRLIATTNKPLLGIGIGTPGLVDTTSGVVLSAVNLDWRGLPLGGLLSARYRLPVYVANDSQLAALAQYMFGGKEYGSNLVVVKVGTGIGAGIVLDGRLLQGDGFGAGEIGRITVLE